MAYDSKLAERIAAVLKGRRHITQKSMFGGLCFLYKGHMVCGVEKTRLVVRVGPEAYAACLKLKHVTPMDFTGRPLTGFVYVQPEGVKRSDALSRWVQRGLDHARSLPPKTGT